MPLVTKSIQFGGTKYITCGDVLGKDVADSFSLSIWFKTTTTASEYLVSKREGASDYRGYGLLIKGDLSGLLEWIVCDVHTAVEARVRTVSTGWNDGEWHHAVVAYNGSVSTSRMMVTIDGAVQALTTLADDTLSSITTAAEFNVSGRTNGLSSIFDGNLCQLSFYSSLLTTDQVVRIYNGGNPLSEMLLRVVAEPMAYWPLGDGDTYPDVLEKAQLVGAPMKAGLKSTYYTLPNKGASIEWARGVSVGDAKPFYVGPGGFCPLATLFSEAAFYRAGPILSRSHTDPWSMSVWVKWSYTNDKYGHMMTRGTAYEGYGYFLRTAYGFPGKLEIYTRNSNVSQGPKVTTVTASFNDNLWHHVVATYDGSQIASGFHIWVDGVDETLVAGGATTLYGLPNASFCLAGYADTAGAQSFAGAMAQAIVYGKKLSGAEVGVLYNAGTPVDPTGLGSAGEIDAYWPMGSINQGPSVEAPAGSGLLGYWKMGDVDTFPTLTDVVGDNDATMTNMEASDITNDTPPRFSQHSCIFDGAEYVTMGNVLGFERTDVFSISVWVKTTDTSGSIVAKWQLAQPGGYLFSVGTGALNFGMAVAWTTNGFWVTALCSVNDGEWHHVAVTFSGNSAATGVKFYFDGVLLTNNAPTFDNLTTSVLNTTDFRLGRDTSGADAPLVGSLDEVAVHDIELSASEVTDIYNGGHPLDLAQLSTSGDLVGYWRMGDRDTFPTLTDHGLGGNDGTMTSMESGDIQTDVPLGKFSLKFGGGTGRVAMGDVLDFERTESFSISVWYKTSSSNTQCIAAKMLSDGSAYPGYSFNVSSTNQLEFDLVNSVATGNWFYTYSAVGVNLRDGEWHHAVVVYDGSSDASNVKFYLDDVLLSNDTPVVNALTGTTLTAADFQIGRRYDAGGATFPFIGSIDDVSVWDKALSGAEVTTIHHDGTPNDLTGSSNLVGYWRCGDGDTYPTLQDNSTGGNDGTMTNMEATDIVNDSPADLLLGTFSLNSVVFGGGDESALLGDVLGFDYDDALSITFWFKWNVPHTGVFVAKVSTDAGSPGYQVICDSSGRILFFLINTYPTNAIEVQTDEFYDDGLWHHFAVTFSGSSAASGVTIYIDGLAVGTTTNVDTLSASTLSSGNLRFGGRDHADIWYQGHLDDVCIYQLEMEQADVLAQYNSGVPAQVVSGGALTPPSWWPDLAEADRPGTLLNMDSSNVVAGPGGVLPKAFTFNGTDESVDLGNVYNFENDQPFSVVFWFKIGSTGVTEYPFGKDDSTWRGYVCWMPSTGELNWVLSYQSGGTNRARIQTVAQFNDDTWHQAIFCYDGSKAAAGLTIYVDGSLQTVTTVDDTLTSSIIDNGPLRFGQRGSNALMWSGDLAGFHLFATELQAAGVTALWNSGTPVDPTGLASATYLVGYWELGAGYFSGVMTNMSSGDIVTDAPSSSDLTRDKSWTTVANYDLGLGESGTVQGGLLLLDWKDKLAANGWTVVGSSTSLAYEYAGATAGPYDLWSAEGDVVYRDSDSGLGPMSWTVLRSPVSPSGQFWLVLAWYGDFYTKMTAYVANSLPALPASPLADYPRPSTDEWFWMLNNGQFYYSSGSSWPMRSYFSAATDGSFIFCRQNMNESDWNAYQMFHVLSDDAFFPDDFPMRATAAANYWTAFTTTWWLTWRCYVPNAGSVPCGVLMHRQGASPNDFEQFLFGEDTVSLNSVALPLYLVRMGPSWESGGVQTILAKVPDLYLSNPGVGRGATAPSKAPYLFTNIEGYLWIPGDTEPSFT